MAKNKRMGMLISMPAKLVTVFEVSEDGGTLRLADYPEPETRAEFYEDMAENGIPRHRICSTSADIESKSQHDKEAYAISHAVAN